MRSASSDVLSDEETIQQRLRAAAAVHEAVGVTEASAIARAARLIADGFRGGGKLLLCGNGGSAADCQHMAAEFVSRLTREFDRPGLAAIALTTDTSYLTAYANDFGFDGVFARQVETLGRPGDVLLAISTSGGSRNVILAAEEARRRKMGIVALVGEGGPLVHAADVVIRVASPDTQLVQQAHAAVEHLICHLVERQVFPGTDVRPT